MQEYAKHIARQMLSTLWGVSARQKICLCPETESCREIDKSFEKGLQGGKHVKNLEIFWMNIQTIIEFVWREKLCWSWMLVTNINDWSSMTKERIETHDDN